MSESYQELDLDNLPTAVVPDDIEIIDEPVENARVEEPAARIPTTPIGKEDDDDDEDEAPAPESAERRKLTRSQRLKNQRDNYARELEAAKAELTTLRGKTSKAEAEASEAAGIGMDFYLKTIDADMKALRRDFDKAMDDGDRDLLFATQQKMVELAAEKKQAEREKRNIPTKAAPSRQDGPAAQPSTPNTPSRGEADTAPQTKAWVGRNADWFQKDAVMTAAAFAIDKEMAGEGYAPSDPEYFEELDKRVKEAFPHKFPAKRAAANSTPTIQNRGSGNSAPTGKIRVVITQEDRAMANSLGLDIAEYARSKAKRERSLTNANQYTEIL